MMLKGAGNYIVSCRLRENLIRGLFLRWECLPRAFSYKMRT